MKKVIILLTSLLMAFVSGCQDHNLEPHPEDVMAWRAGGPAGDSGQDIAVDQSGNVYVTGGFTGTATFGSTTLISNGISDIFIVKYNNKGDVLWAKQAGGPLADQGYGITLDEQGNFYITGYISGTATFGTLSLTSTGERDIFISKYSTNGEVQWARNAGGTNFDSGYGIALDRGGNPYVTGSFQSTATFGTTTLTSRGSNDVFIAKYNSNGDILWAQQAGGTDSDGVSDIAVDENGNAYIIGSFTGTATFGAFTLTAVAHSRATDSNLFVVKYNSAGEALWVRQESGMGSFGSGIAVDGSGNVYVTGTIYIGAFTPDIHIAKYTTTGEIQWSGFIGRMGGTEYGADIAVDKNGNVYVIGRTHGSQIGIGKRTSSGLVSVDIDIVHYGDDDIIVVKFDNNGNLYWARSAGGPGDDVGLGIAVDEQGTAYTTGYFPGTATFGTTTLTSSGDIDVFVAKFK
ncbi:SBBP repeat-containing protein [Telluribacter sp. SYSU D00476]|uniref:SBBP repeat-containing protein n=1 Tax=Telluribacter sp. SYSU D00476 TaxID=2811430 RepID=UPI001FF379B1|nr:SBBP repeat-containing protein [Telluribacter sp. SYSU D00476]